MLALHASLLALKAKRPVRMIYERHEDISATTKRHPAIVRHRTGVTSDGVLVAQDVEVVMDGGAYCTLTPVVLSRGLLHAGGPYRCPNVRLRARATRTNTPPNGAFRGFGAPQTEFAAEMQLNRIAERLGHQPGRAPAPERLPAQRHDPDRPGAARERGGRGGARAGARRQPLRAHPRADGARGGRAARLGHDPAGPAAQRRAADRERHRARAGVARRRVHRLGRGVSRLGGLGRADGRGPAPRADREHRDGPGHEDGLPADGRDGARRAGRLGRVRAAGHRRGPRFRPDRREPDGHGRRRARDPRRAEAQGRGRGAQPGRAVPRGVPRRREGQWRDPHRPAVRAVPGRRVRRRDVRRATPIRPTAGPPRWRASRWTSTRPRCASAT